MSLATIWAIAIKDLRQFFRDRTLMLFMLLLPVMQLALLAQATGRGITDVSIGVLDYDRSSESRAFIALLEASERFHISTYPETWEAGERAIEDGSIYALVIIPQDMTAALYNAAETSRIQIIIDATSSIMSRVVEGSTEQVLRRFAEQRGRTIEMGVQVEPVMLFNPSLESRPYTIGAQLGFITYQITLGVAALGLAREQEIGTLEQLMVTPVRRFELLLGKVLPPTLIGIVDFLVLLMVIQYGFNIPNQGSFWFLVAGSLLFILVEVVWGTMLSALAGTQQQAILLVFIQAMVDVALSGYLVPVRDMPGIFRLVAQFVPLNYYLVFVRAVLLKGARWVDMWPQLAILTGLGCVIAVIATLTISRNLD
jgi:ABC-2 type transport system permease protein